MNKWRIRLILDNNWNEMVFEEFDLIRKLSFNMSKYSDTANILMTIRKTTIFDCLLQILCFKLKNDIGHDVFNLNKNFYLDKTVLLSLYSFLKKYFPLSAEEEIKEIKSENTKNLKTAINRLFTYIENTDNSLDILKLTTNGLYFRENNICCAFCTFKLALVSRDAALIVQSHRDEAPECVMFDDNLENHNVGLALTLDFAFESHRRLTFSLTTWQGHVPADELASCGFRWSGYEDATRCAFCVLEVCINNNKIYYNEYFI